MEGESKEERDRRKGCTYCIGHDAIVVVVVVVPSAPLSYARSERDYLARRERANIGSYSSRLYGAYVPTGFLRAFPPTYSPPLSAAAPRRSGPRRRALPPSLTWISTPLLSAPCIFGSARNSTFLSARVNSREAARFIARASRSLVNHPLSKIRFRLQDICKK